MPPNRAPMPIREVSATAHGDPIVSADTEFQPKILVKRKPLTVAQRHRQYQYLENRKAGISELFSKCQTSWRLCSFLRVWGFISRRIPILEWLPSYKIKEYMLGDIVSGITVSIVNIPQGMAYAVLAGVGPVFGLYTAFFPVLLYVFLGTSKHVSLGAFAVTSLMVREVVERIAVSPDGALTYNSTANETENVTSAGSGDDVTEGYSAIEVACIVALASGFWELLLGLLQLGFLCVILSDMLVSGFTTGAACHGFTSQVHYLFGIRVARHTGPFKLIYTYCDIFKNISSANVAEIIVSLVCITILLVNNEIIKPIVRKRTKIPVPIELIVVILGTVISYFGHVNQRYGVEIVGSIPTGLPRPRLPRVELFKDVLVESLVIGLVAFMVSFSLARIFAKKKKYSVDATQELYAHGLCNIFASFFCCVTMAASMSKSLIQEDVGGMTQLASLLSCVIILMVILFIAPVFQTLPNAEEVPGFRICQFSGALHFANRDAFSRLVVASSSINPGEILRQRGTENSRRDGKCWGNGFDNEAFDSANIQRRRNCNAVQDDVKICFSKESANGVDNSLFPSSTVNKYLQTNQAESIHWLVLDISGVSSIDISASNTIIQVYKDYREVGITLVLAGVSEQVMSTLQRSDAFDVISEDDVFHSVHDAVSFLCAKNTKISGFSNF